MTRHGDSFLPSYIDRQAIPLQISGAGWSVSGKSSPRLMRRDGLPCRQLSSLIRKKERFFRKMRRLEIKAYALAWYDRPELDGLTKEKEDELQDKMQKRKNDAPLVHQQVFPSSTNNLLPDHRYL
ncbi:hypothetical protein HMPREF9141_0903 [Prevotella multiformis DSM 16608]|uniref:Uncharacterized protein n=1 Tax=Prevotella multiformis DSM 16608 TaxID=888743 RepID=F0F5N7_9BACT|nr:hypothetical protein HMPREF9141_0903 [Prevotella multiformis DSM 16608]